MSIGKILLGLGGVALLYEWYTGGLTSLMGGSASGSGSSVPASTSPIYTDAQLLAGFNSIPYSSSIPQDQIARIAAQLAPSLTPANFPTVTPGSLLAYVLGLGNGQGDSSGQTIIGTDGKQYQWNGSLFNKLNGLGMIINLHNMFMNTVPGSGFGDEEFSPSLDQTLNGLGEIVNDPANSAAYIDEGPFNEAAQFGGSSSGNGNVNDFLLAAQGQGA